ncbi:hypothetical protein PG989_000837 [Apiospora arundinis]
MYEYTVRGCFGTPLVILFAALAGSVLAESAQYDYVIAGAGTAGLVVANRLSANPSTTVLVIEPGGDERLNPNVTDPLAFTVPFGTHIDWQCMSF